MKDFNNNPLISIVTPVYNSEPYLRDTIKSVIEQSYSNWELILIDDGSTDKTRKIIEEYVAKDKRILFFENKSNCGPAISRNKGIDVARGEYISFLDADDLWSKNFLETSIGFCQRKNVNFSFSSYKRVDENLQPIMKDFIVPEIVNYKSILKTCPILLSSSLFNVEKMGKHYMPNLAKRQDWGFFLSILKCEDGAYGIKESLVTYRIRKDSISRNKWKVVPYVWKVYREVEGFSVFTSSYFFVHWALNGFKKYHM